MPSDRSHPSDLELLAVTQAQLNSRELNRLIDHIDGCSDCQHRIEALAAETRLQTPALASLRGRTLPQAETAEQKGRGFGIWNAKIFFFRKLRSSSWSPTPEQDSAAPNRSSVLPVTTPPPERVGPYRILNKIGSGGMGVVYRARHIHLGRDVAIKWLADSVADRATAQRVIREWRAHGALSHPHIVSAIDAGIHDGLPYLVTEFIRGADLSRIVAAAEPLTIGQTLMIVRQIADAVRYIHGRGMAHLDIKPSNVMLDEAGKVFLLDLGTAQIQQKLGDGPASLKNISGAFWGTLAYLAPERITLMESATGQMSQSGESSLDDDSRPADLYSLGCTIHFLLTGKPPFPIDADKPKLVQSKGILQQHLHAPAQRLGQLRGELAKSAVIEPVQSLIDSMMAKEPQDRLTIENVITALDELEADERIDEFSDGSSLAKSLTNLLDPVNDFSVSDPSGHMLAPTNLVLLSKPSPPPRRWWQISLGIVGLMLGLLLVGLMLGKPARLFAPTTQTKLTGKVPQRSILQWSPSGFLPGAHRLTKAAQKMDSTITTTSIETIVPRSGATSLQWSPDGRWLVVQTYLNRFYVYRLEEDQLKFVTVFRIHPPGLQRFCWHPFDGSVLIWSQSQLFKIRFGPRGQVQQTLLEGDYPKQGDLLCCVADGEHALVLFAANDMAGTCIGWDPQQGQSTKLPFTYQVDSEKRASLVGLSLAVSHDQQHLITHEVEQLQIYRFEYKLDGWQCISTRSGTLPSRQPLWKMGWSQDDSCVVVGQEDLLLFFGSDDLSSSPLEPVKVAGPHKTGKTTALLGRFEGARNGWDTFELAGGYLFQTRLALPDPSGPAPSPSKSYRGATGEGYGYATMAAHPQKPCVVIASCGALEIVDQQLNTVFEFPQVATLLRPLALQTGVESLITRRDGAAMVMKPDGEIIKSIPPPAFDDHKSHGVSQQTILEPERRLLQRSSRSDHPTRSVDLSKLDLSPPIEAGVIVTLLSQFFQIPGTPQLPPAAKNARNKDQAVARIMFGASLPNDEPEQWIPRQSGFNAYTKRMIGRATQAGVVAFADRQRYTVITSDEQIVGEMPILGANPTIDLSPSGETLYLAIASWYRAHLFAIDWRREEIRWKTDAPPSTGSRFDIATLNDSTLALVWEGGLAMVETADGRITGNINTLQRYGLRHSHALSHLPGNQTFTWRNGYDIHALASWSPKLELQWLAFATGSHGGIVFASDGRILDSTVPGNSQPSRFRWSEDEPLEAIVTLPEQDSMDSFVIVEHHEDGQITIRPYREILTQL